MNTPKTRNENIVVQEMDNEILIYDLKENKAFCLNETSAMIWQLCDGKHSIAEMSLSLSKKLNQPMTDDLIWLALDNFKKDNLLEDSQKFEIDFNGLTRRQVVKKIGFSSLIVLPVIASLVAPAAAATASLLPNTAACNFNPAACQSNNCVPNAIGGTTCCAAGTGSPSGVNPGNSTCTPVGNCLTNYNATRCCTQSGVTLIAGPNGCTAAGFELCQCL